MAYEHLERQKIYYECKDNPEHVKRVVKRLSKEGKKWNLKL